MMPNNIIIFFIVVITIFLSLKKKKKTEAVQLTSQEDRWENAGLHKDKK